MVIVSRLPSHWNPTSISQRDVDLLTAHYSWIFPVIASQWLTTLLCKRQDLLIFQKRGNWLRASQLSFEKNIFTFSLSINITLWPNWRVAELVCGRTGLWPNWFVAELTEAELVCGRIDRSPAKVIDSESDKTTRWV